MYVYVSGDVCMYVGMYVWVCGCMYVCAWGVCTFVRERKPVAQKEIKSAKVRARKYKREKLGARTQKREI